MNRAILLCTLVLVALPLACQQQPDMSVEETSINTALQRYVRAIEFEDLERYTELMAHDPSMVNFGTFGEPVRGWETLKTVIEAQNASLTDTEIKMSDVRVSIGPSGALAWATCLWDLRTQMGEQSLALPVRCTWVFEKREGDWKIVHWHKSVPAG